MTKTRKNIIRICFVCDENYLEKMMVAIGSILECRALDDKYEIFVISNSIGEAGKERVLSLSQKNIMIRVIDCELKKDFPQQRWNRRISKSALLKFEIVNCFPNIDKILYLDADVLILQDINIIYSTDLGENYAAVVKDFRVIDEKQCIDVDITYGGYFNSGVMLLNLKKMRECNVYDKIVDYRMNKKNTYMDQDAFNYGLKNHVQYISLHCNAAISSIWYYKYEKLRKFYRLVERNIFEFYKNIILLHFSSAIKPWDYYDMPFSNIYAILNEKYVRGHLNRKSLALANINKEHQLPYMKSGFIFEKELIKKIQVKKCTVSVTQKYLLAKIVGRKKVFWGVDAFKSMAREISYLVEFGDILIDTTGNDCGKFIYNLPVCSMEILAHLYVRMIVIILDDRYDEARINMEQFCHRYSVEFIDGKLLIQTNR